MFLLNLNNSLHNKKKPIIYIGVLITYLNKKQKLSRKQIIKI